MPRRIAILAVLLLFEALAIWCLYFTAGDAAQIFAILLAAGTAGLGAVLLTLGKTDAGAGTIGVGAIVVILFTLWTGMLWLRLHLEAQRFVIYSYELQARSGEFPEDLTRYQFRDSLLADHIQRYERRDDGFSLVFYVTFPSVSYWYDSETGWGYYPD